MSKRRKTRQEKIITELRNQLLKKPTASSVSLIDAAKKEISYTTQYVSVFSYNPVALRGDLLKIIITTCVIVGLELFLFFILKNRIIVLPIEA
ncbi:MAG: hypothetical protein A3B53_01675 [Candidatus Levybacteria bacterium RIFCSPLOWO2_01_FULL_42_15]|nr:MAG: hypothetical protein A3B53_01675 [Candidatus Levybacteria bacterium RIFCSPLOWO2_01_FULL_42_15]